MAKFESQPVQDIMVWAGTHGKRRLLRGSIGKSPRGEGGLGIPLVRSLQKNPVRTENGLVEAGIANPEAVRLGLRYVEANLPFCFGNPEDFKETYEGRLVPGILKGSENKDLVLDIHQQYGTADTDYVYVGSHVSPQVLGFAAAVGINTVMVTDNGIQGHIPQAMIVDLSQNSKRNDVEYWRDKLLTVLKEGVPSPPVEEFHHICSWRN